MKMNSYWSNPLIIIEESSSKFNLANENSFKTNCFQISITVRSTSIFWHQKVDRKMKWKVLVGKFN